MNQEKNKTTKLKDLPPQERPYEKCFRYGAECLTDTELVAVLLKCGTQGATSIDVARELLTMPDGSVNILALSHKSAATLMKCRGIGQVKAITLKCVAEIAKRCAAAKYTNDIDFGNPSHIALYYSEKMRHLNHEEARLVCLNGSNRFLGDTVLSFGSVNQTLLSTREIFLKALEYGAVYIVLLHNHPGGNPMPSRCDIEMTEKVAKAGALMDIRLIDHIIIGDTSFVSMRESGYI